MDAIVERPGFTRLERALRDPDTQSGLLTGLGVLGFLVFVGVIYPAPISILFLGMVLGSLSALLAMGLVLVYRANRIINFAQGDLGGLAAVLAASLIVGPNWPYVPAALVGLAAALLLGALTDMLFIRRFAKAPRLFLTVATIGIAQLFAFGQLGLPRLFNYDVVPQPTLPFKTRFEWFPVVFNAGHVLIMVVVPLVVVALVAFFRLTRVGVAVRASAESADRAALLGIPVKRIGTLVWVIAAALSGLAVLLRLPIQGVSLGAVLGPSLLLRALAAAVIGRMENLPVTFGAAVAIGMLEQAAFFETNRTVVVDGVLFFVILVGILAQRRGRVSRADELEATSWATVKEVRPIPRELRRLPEVRWTIPVVGVVAALLLLLIPLQLSISQVNLFTVGLIFAIVILSLVILTGWAGQISLGQLAFMAFGTAVAGSLAQQGKNFFVCILVAALVGAGLAVVIGIPALRIRGPFLALATLSLAVATGTYFLNAEFFGWLVPDPDVRVLRPILFDKFDLESEYTYYYVVLAAMVLVLGSVWSLRHSRTGRVLVATRDNARAAQSYGISPTKARIAAFALSGFFAALAGGLYFYSQHGFSGRILQAEQNMLLFAMGVIGGLASIPGALLGAAFLMWVNFSSFTREPLARFLASGVGVLTILLVLPSGLGGLLYDIRDAVLRRIARWRGVVVPSLLADVQTDPNLRADHPQIARDPHAGPREGLLTVRDLDVAYGKTQVLFGVDFHVERGEIVALLGTNGAGKSTLLSAISGLVPARGGQVVFDGRDVTGDDPNATVAAGIVFMPGGRGVFPTLTVQENLDLAGWLYRKEPEYLAEAMDQVLAYFPILRERAEQKAGNLSGGEQQMLTLAQAFIARPRLLMIDELSLGLAPVIVEQLLGIVQAIHANGTTIVLVEQSVNLAITLARRAVFLEKGEVRFDGATADLLERPDILRAVFLRGAAAARAGGNGEVVRLRDLAPFVPVCEHCGHQHPVALEAMSLSATFGGVRAVNDVDLVVHQGQILGIIGPNGAGKTTLFDLFSGFVPPASGRIHLDGTDITGLTPDARAALGLGRSFQDARLFPSMTVREAIAVALERHIATRDPVAAALISPATRMSERFVDGEVVRLIELMHLEAFADKFVGELSTGTRRIVDLACSLAHQPSVLLLDEPSTGIAQRETEALGPALVDIRDKTGAALIIIEHDMPLVTSISDELVALDLGSVVARGEPNTVISDPVVIEGYLGGTEAVIRRSGRRSKASAR